MALYENVDIYVLSTDLPATPIEGAVVKVMSEDGSQFFSQNTTDVNGKASFLLPSAFTYQLRFYKFSVSFQQPQYITVEPAPIVNTFEVFGALYHYPEATDQRLCQASGFFRDPSGGLGRNIDMHFIAKFDPILLEGAPILVERISQRTNDKGYVSLSLIRNACYDVTLEGFDNVVRNIVVPDQPWVNIGDLLFNRVKGIEFDPEIVGGVLNMNVGDQLTFNVTVSTMARYNLKDITKEVAWKTSDFSIVAFDITPTTIIIKALAVGTATISADRRDKTTIVIPDLPITGVPITVNVL